MGASSPIPFACADSDLVPAIDPTIMAAIRSGAWFVFNLSGGKDSTASAHTAIALLNALGHPADRRLAIHADLGRAEWRSTPDIVAAIAARAAIAGGPPQRRRHGGAVGTAFPCRQAPL